MATDVRRGRSRRITGSFLLVAAVASACAGAKEGAQTKSSPRPFAFDQRIGWLDGPCLAIADSGLAIGTVLAVVLTDEPQSVRRAQLGAPTDAATTCRALLPGRAAMNAKPGMFFYDVTGDSIDTDVMGIGIVSPDTTPAIVGGAAQADLDEDGVREVFSSCATSEGIRFNVWSDQANKGSPRWSGYYYLDYDTTPNCP